MQKAVIKDESASVRLVSWKEDINKIELCHTYYLKRAIVRLQQAELHNLKQTNRNNKKVHKAFTDSMKILVTT